MPKTRGNYFRWLYDDNIQIPDRTRYRYKAKERTIQPLINGDIENGQNQLNCVNLNEETSCNPKIPKNNQTPILSHLEVNQIEVKLEKIRKIMLNILLIKEWGTLSQ
jgi:hypothetical protein